MTRPEQELLCALFALYAYECVFWMQPAAYAYTRSVSGWRTHAGTLNSFSLLRRRPVLADPFLLRPGFVRTESKADEGTLARVAEDLADFSMLATQCRLQAALLLLGLPALLLTGQLTPLWKPYVGLLLFNHALLCWWLYRALRVLPAGVRGKLFAAAIANPLGATRVLDPLAQALYDTSPQSADNSSSRQQSVV